MDSELLTQSYTVKCAGAPLALNQEQIPCVSKLQLHFQEGDPR